MSLKIVFEMQTIHFASPPSLHIKFNACGWSFLRLNDSRVNPFFICLVIRKTTSKKSNYKLNINLLWQWLATTSGTWGWLHFTSPALPPLIIAFADTVRPFLSSVSMTTLSSHPKSFARPPEDTNNCRSPLIQSSSIKKIYSQIFPKLKLKLFNYYLYKRKRLIWICFNFSSRNSLFVVLQYSVFGKSSRLTGITIMPWRRF